MSHTLQNRGDQHASVRCKAEKETAVVHVHAGLWRAGGVFRLMTKDAFGSMAA